VCVCGVCVCQCTLELGRKEDVADAPAGQAVALGEGEDVDHVRSRGRPVRSPVEHKVLVGLVRDQPQPCTHNHQTYAPCVLCVPCVSSYRVSCRVSCVCAVPTFIEAQLLYLLDGLGRGDGAGGVVGRDEHDGLGLGRNQRRQHRQVRR
jgi:hypothetical protein